MNYRGCRQRFLPLPDLSRKIEGDSVRRVPYQKSEKIIQTLLLFHDMVVSTGPFNPFAPRDFAKKGVLKLVEWFSGHCRATQS